MKKGIIIYITGKVPEGADEDILKMTNCQDIHADAVEIVISKFESEDIHYAWWKLVTKGSHNIHCKSAFFDTSGNLVFTGRELKLFG